MWQKRGKSETEGARGIPLGHYEVALRGRENACWNCGCLQQTGGTRCRCSVGRSRWQGHGRQQVGMGGQGCGLRVYPDGVELKGDGRKRERLPGVYKVIVKPNGWAHFRGKVRAWSPASAERLALIPSSVDPFHNLHDTLIYLTLQASWETAGDRNRRLVGRCKKDLHRFLRGHHARSWGSTSGSGSARSRASSIATCSSSTTCPSRESPNAGHAHQASWPMRQSSPMG